MTKTTLSTCNFTLYSNAPIFISIWTLSPNKVKKIYPHCRLDSLLTYCFILFYNVKSGGDDINQLCEADDAEFKEICDLVGMSSKPLHVRRLRKAIHEYKADVLKIKDKLNSRQGHNGMFYISSILLFFSYNYY